MPRADVLLPGRRAIRIPGYVAGGNVRTREPVSSLDWRLAGELGNHLIGTGRHLVRGFRPDDVLSASATGTYRLILWPSRCVTHRVWQVGLSLDPASSGDAEITFTDPSSGTGGFRLSSRSAVTPYSQTFAHVETITSPTSSETQVAPTIAVAAGSLDVTVTWLSCWEVPRIALPGDATELGVSLGSLDGDTPIYADTGVSLGGLATQLDDARDISQRSGLFAWAVDSTGAFSTTSGSAVAIFNGDISQLARYLYNGVTTRTIEARAYVRAGTTTAGQVQLAMASGDTLNLDIPSGSSGEWVTGQIDVHAEDLSAADGRRSSTWDTMNAKLVRTSGANSVFIESLILGRG